MAGGYSRRSLVEKLGIKAGARLSIVNAPGGYMELLAELPPGVTVTEGLEGPLPFIHLFTRSRAHLAAELPRLRRALALNGTLWVSWPKLSSKVATDLNERVVREVGLSHGLVDIKVAAIDEVWSGLKFVVPLKDRK